MDSNITEQPLFTAYPVSSFCKLVSIFGGFGLIALTVLDYFSSSARPVDWQFAVPAGLLLFLAGYSLEIEEKNEMSGAEIVFKSRLQQQIYLVTKTLLWIAVIPMILLAAFLAYVWVSGIKISSNDGIEILLAAILVVLYEISRKMR